MSQEPSIPTAKDLADLLAAPSALREPLVGFKAFDLIYDDERQVANVYSPTERQFEWWSWQEGAVHHHRDPPLCTRTGRYEFEPEERKGVITVVGHSEESPVQDCDCGYWMFARLEDCRATYSDLVSSPAYAQLAVQQRRLICLVWGDGTSFVNEISFRSRYLTFAAIPRLSGSAEKWCERMADDYGIECLTEKEMEEYRRRAGVDPLQVRREVGEQDGSETWEGKAS